MNHAELRRYLGARGYTLIELKRWKAHDWIVFKIPPNITYGRLILDCHLEDCPDATIHALFGRELR